MRDIFSMYYERYLNQIIYLFENLQTLFFFLYTKEILNLLFPNANQGIEILKVSSISIVFAILSQTISGAMQGLGKVFEPAKAYGIGILIKIICNIVLLKNPNMGAKGAAIGTVICNLIAFLILYRDLIKEVKFTIDLKISIFKLAMSTFLMGLISNIVFIFIKNIFSEKISIIIIIFISISIYLIFISIFKFFNNDIKNI